MKLLLPLFALLLTWNVCAQETANPTSRQEQALATDYYSRLGIDYSIKDNPSPDADVIRSIPFPNYEKYRMESTDLEISDPGSGYVIILFSEEKCRLNKQH